MSFADYLRLRNYLDRPGETVLTGRVAVTHAFNPDDDRDALSTLANEAAVLLGLHDRCGACGGFGGEGEWMEDPTECEYCNGSGTQSAGSFTSAIDRLAMCDLALERHGITVPNPADADGFSLAEHYALPTAPCETCAVVQCLVCQRRKKPYGRDASMQSYLCDSDCNGYHREPYAGTHWDSDDCPDCDGTGRKPNHEWKRSRPIRPGARCSCFVPTEPDAELTDVMFVIEHGTLSADCKFHNDRGFIAFGPGPRGVRESSIDSEICEACDGSGRGEEDEAVEGVEWVCPICEGSGLVAADLDYPMGHIPSGNLAWHRLVNLEFKRIYARDFPGPRSGRELSSFALLVMTSAKFRVMLARQAVERAED